jgi:CheY-like chemotaxis protein
MLKTVKTVILIDDDPDDLEILKDAISSLQPDAHCISFALPVEAVRVVSEELVVIPDYFFIDINMPGMTGDECLNLLRQKKEFRNSVMTILSTSIPPAVSRTLKNLGADYTFEKPSTISDYSKIVSQVLQL